ncbi:MAG TPA: PGPGW domain-containing protein [Thermoanaerobaculia bacterium]|nr:PGPGW domain-containing protein [Thermoanaerobaculia bacterium]
MSTQLNEPRLSREPYDPGRPEEISIEIPLDGYSESNIPPEELERASRALERISPGNRVPLPLGIRIGIFVIGWLLILIGIAGLVLPGIQGVFTIVAGAALISLDNEMVYRGLRRVFQRWPRIWDRIERFREKSHAWIQRRIHKNKSKA